MPWVDEAALDDPDALRALDTRDSLRSLASAGAQVRRALVSAEEAGVSRAAGGERPRSVLVAALGGSSLVCDVLDLLAEPGSPVPVTTRRDAPLPGWVGPLDLVIAVSQSGRAAGPLALAAEAARRGAVAPHRRRRRLPARRRLRPRPRRARRRRAPHARRRAPPCGRCSPRCSSPPTPWASSSAPRPSSSGSPTCSTRSPRSAAPAPRPSSTRPRSSPPAWASTVPGRARRRPPHRRRRRPRRLDAGPHRAGPGHPRRPCPDAASQVVACLDGPFGSGPGRRRWAGRRHRRHLRRPLPRRPAHPAPRPARAARPRPRPRSRRARRCRGRLGPRVAASPSSSSRPARASRSSAWPRSWPSPTSPPPTSRSGWGSTRRSPATSPSCATAPPDTRHPGQGGRSNVSCRPTRQSRAPTSCGRARRTSPSVTYPTIRWPELTYPGGGLAADRQRGQRAKLAGWMGRSSVTRC